MTNISTPCARTDLFAVYGSVRLAVVGWSENGTAIVQKLDGATGNARAVRVRDEHGNRQLFERVESVR